MHISISCNKNKMNKLAYSLSLLLLLLISNLDKCVNGEDEQDNAAHRMVVVLGFKPPGVDEYTLWVLDGATVPSITMNFNTSTLVLCPETLNMAPNATMVDLPSKIAEVANSIAASGGNCLSTQRDSFFDMPNADHRKEVAGILALESIG